MWRIGIGGWTIARSNVGRKCIARSAEVLRFTKLQNVTDAVKSSGHRIWLTGSARNAERRIGLMDADTVIKLVTEKLEEIAKIFDQFEGKDDSTFINMSVCDTLITATLMSVKKCDECNHREPVVHGEKYISRA
jgi:hypothetical protein